MQQTGIFLSLHGKTYAYAYAVTQTFAPLIDSAVDDTLLQTGPLGNQTSLQIVPIEGKRNKKPSYIVLG